MCARHRKQARAVAVPVPGKATLGELVAFVLKHDPMFKLVHDRRGHRGGWFRLSRELRILRMTRVHTQSSGCPVNRALLSDKATALDWANRVQNNLPESCRPHALDLDDLAKHIAKAAKTIQDDDARNICATAYVLGTPAGLCSVPAVRDMIPAAHTYWDADSGARLQAMADASNDS
jgi:hypothetical protein